MRDDLRFLERRGWRASFSGGDDRGAASYNVGPTFMVGQALDAVGPTFMVGQALDAVGPTFMVGQALDAVGPPFRGGRAFDDLGPTFMVGRPTIYIGLTAIAGRSKEEARLAQRGLDQCGDVLRAVRHGDVDALERRHFGFRRSRTAADDRAGVPHAFAFGCR